MERRLPASPARVSLPSHAGCTLYPQGGLSTGEEYLIHPPTLTATRIRKDVCLRVKSISNPPPTRGATAGLSSGEVVASVSIHASTRSATSYCIARIQTLLPFQFTHPRGVRLQTGSGQLKQLRFQFTHPRGVRPASKETRETPESFNSRTLVGCDLIFVRHKSPYYKFQFTHPRGVRLQAFTRACRRGSVSIHAPTPTATCIRKDVCLRVKSISIHPPTQASPCIRKDVCLRVKSISFTHAGFAPYLQGGLPTGEEYFIHPPTPASPCICKEVCLRVKRVSIHAPTRGATRAAPRMAGGGDRFNSRTHVGCDHIPMPVSCSPMSFNSRTHEGCDCILPEES